MLFWLYWSRNQYFKVRLKIVLSLISLRHSIWIIFSLDVRNVIRNVILRSQCMLSLFCHAELNRDTVANCLLQVLIAIWLGACREGGGLNLERRRLTSARVIATPLPPLPLLRTPPDPFLSRLDSHPINEPEIRVNTYAINVLSKKIINSVYSRFFTEFWLHCQDCIPKLVFKLFFLDYYIASDISNGALPHGYKYYVYCMALKKPLS